MKGNKTPDPSVKIISIPIRIRKMTIGINHHFFLSIKKIQSSLTILNLPTLRTSLY